MIHVVTGAPCSGKSTYIREHAAEGDVLVDFDAIAQALGAAEPHGSTGAIRDAAFKARNAVVNHLCDNADELEGWIVHSDPADWQREKYEAVGAELVELDADMQTCLERAERDGRPPGEADRIREWFATREQAPKGAFFMPEKEGIMNRKTNEVEIKAESNGSITGYASTWTREPDSYGDIVAKGAFAECIASIEAEGRALPLLWNHDGGNLKSYIGTVTSLAEDDHGLLFTADFDATEEAQRARELAADGRLAKFSFAYNVLDQMQVELDDGRKANELRKLDIFEVSLVLYPANADTSVVEVKTAEPATGGTVKCPVTLVGAYDQVDLDAIAKSLTNVIERKAGRRNSAKDADDLARILELCGSIQSIVNGLLAETRDEPDEPQEPEAEADAAAKSEEPDTANDEEPRAKGDVDALVREASELLKGGQR